MDGKEGVRLPCLANVFSSSLIFLLEYDDLLFLPSYHTDLSAVKLLVNSITIFHFCLLTLLFIATLVLKELIKTNPMLL